MKSVVVDTNVVLSFVTDRDPRQQQAAGRLFESAATGEIEIVLAQAVVLEIVYVLENFYRVTDREVAVVIEDLLAMPHVAVENDVPWSSVLDAWPRRVLDFADAVLVAVARAGGHAIASFDRQLTRGLKRLGVAPHPLR